MRRKLLCIIVLLFVYFILTLSAGEGKPCESCDMVGVASWYGEWHRGRKTANGERFNPDLLTAAHPSLPMGTRLKVINLENQRVVFVRVNDRGPYVNNRVIDLSKQAARQLGMVKAGIQRVCIVEVPDI